VKHPHIDEQLRVDFYLMLKFARLASCIPLLRDLRFDDSLSQFGVPLQQQLSMRLEADNLEMFANNFR
jgi:predicted unusual protein kinase regulating ubiquinone biosynthesis (AarF/ABC1/UbiB family)